MKKPYLLLVCLILSFGSLANPKPLFDVGSAMVMQENAENGDTLSINYTFDPHFAQIPK